MIIHYDLDESVCPCGGTGEFDSLFSFRYIISDVLLGLCTVIFVKEKIVSKYIPAYNIIEIYMTYGYEYLTEVACLPNLPSTISPATATKRRVTTQENVSVN